jgi:hypothetical protein
MTEADWLAATDPTPMLVSVREMASDRKRRLFAVACCRSIWGMLPDERTRNAVRISEQYADGLAAKRELEASWKETWDNVDIWDNLARDAEVEGPAHLVWAKDIAARAAAFAVDADFPEFAAVAGEAEILVNQIHKGRRAAEDEEEDFLVLLVRDIFGNPFRQPSIEPALLAWNGGAVKRLAEAAYQERALPAGTLDQGRLTVLADALEEAGCDDEEILGHLRKPGPHVRGCWVIDLLTGRE